MEKQEKNNLNLNIFLKDKVLEIQTLKNSSGMLKAPVNGNMNRRISEGIDAELTLKIIDKNKKMLFIDRSITTGLEVVGNIDELFKN